MRRLRVDNSRSCCPQEVSDLKDEVAVDMHGVNQVVVSAALRLSGFPCKNFSDFLSHAQKLKYGEAIKHRKGVSGRTYGELVDSQDVSEGPFELFENVIWQS